MNPTDAGHAQIVSTFLDFIKKLAEVSVLLGAVLFLIGWSYLYGYYSGFGLSSDDLGLSASQVLVHCVPVILGRGFLLTGAISVVVLVIVGYLGRTKWLLRKFVFILALVLLGVYSATRYATGLGREYAERDSFVSTTKLPYVTLEGVRDNPGVGCGLDESNYRFLLRSNGHIFVVLPIESSIGSSDATNLRVCSFLDSSIQALRIQVGLGER